MLRHFETRGSFLDKDPKLVDHPQTLWSRVAGSPLVQDMNRNRRIGWVVVIGWTAALILWLLYRGLVRPEWVNIISDGAYEFLTLVEAGSVFTLMCLWSVLTYWQMREDRDTPGRGDTPYPMAALTADEMYTLSPADFEKYTASLFRMKGYDVKVRGRSGDSGVDLDIKSPDGRRAVAQCKRYNKTVGSEIVRELFGTMIHERASHAFLITTANISKAARDWAKGKPITLIDGAKLEQIAASIEDRT